MKISNPTWYLVAGIIFARGQLYPIFWTAAIWPAKWNMVTDFGFRSCPTADRQAALTTVAFIYMLLPGTACCSPVVLCIILARRFTVSACRMVAAGAKGRQVIAQHVGQVRLCCRC